MRNWTLFSLAITSAAACANSSQPVPVTDPPLATCVLDAWLENSDPCACGSPLVTSPECGASDCREGNTLVLRSDGTSLTLILRWSDSRKTFSAVGGSAAILRGHWTLVAGEPPRLRQTFDATKTTFETAVKCTAARLVRVDKNTYDRAPQALAKGVLQTDGTDWQALPYNP